MRLGKAAAGLNQMKILHDHAKEHPRRGVEVPEFRNHKEKRKKGCRQELEAEGHTKRLGLGVDKYGWEPLLAAIGTGIQGRKLVIVGG